MTVNRGARQSRFERIENDFYATNDPRAVAALLPHLPDRCNFIEPCAGDGALVRQLVAAGHVCMDAFDIAPQADGIRQADALAWDAPRNPEAIIITNPPYDWRVLSAMIPLFCERAWQSWLLLEASFMHTKRAAPLMRRCRKIVSIGRLKWVVGSAHGSTKDYCWYQFGKTVVPRAWAAFYPRECSK